FAVGVDRTAEITSGEEVAVSNLAPARYRVLLSGLGELCYQASPAILDLTAGGRDAPMLLTVAAAGAIRGKLGGTTRPGEYAIALVPANPENDLPLQLSYPATDGKFTFSALRPGPHWIAVHPKTDKARWVRDPNGMIVIQVVGGAPTDVELPAPTEGKE